MTRPECSYWVSIEEKSNLIEEIQKDLESSHIIDYMAMTRDNNHIYLEVAEGTTEQTDEIKTVCEKIAKKYPSALVSYCENNEELYSPDVQMEWNNGKLYREDFGRKLAPRETDPYTANICLNLLLASSSKEEAIRFIKELL